MATDEGSGVGVSEGTPVDGDEPTGLATGGDPAVLTDGAPQGGWWLPVLLAAVAFPVNVVGGFAIGLAGSAVGGVPDLATNVLWAVVGTTLVVSSVAVHFDRQYVASVSDWTPTRLYYFTFLGYVGMLLAIHYVWRRHRLLGVP